MAMPFKEKKRFFLKEITSMMVHFTEGMHRVGEWRDALCHEPE